MHTRDANSDIQSTISSEDSGKKLFLVVRHLAPHLSKSEVRELFAAGAISINSVSVRGHIDEARRSELGDLICVRMPRTLKTCVFEVLFSSSSVVALKKDPGVSLSPESDLSKYAFSLLGDSAAPGTTMDTDWVYRLDRAVAGVCVAAKGSALRELRSLLSRNHLTLTFRAVVCGTVSSRVLRHESEPGMELHVVVRSVQQCRAVEAISSVDFSPLFDTGETAGSAEHGGLVKSIRRLLAACGHRVVGEGSAVKEGKGLFLALLAAQIEGRPPPPLAEDDGCRQQIPELAWRRRLEIPEPTKFSALLGHEAAMYERALQKDLQTMQKYTSDSVASGGSSVSEASPSAEEDRSRLAARVPVEYLTGRALFDGRWLHVSPAVMVPRKPSEAVVAAGVHAITTLSHPIATAVLDIGTGSGCLLLAAIDRLRAAGFTRVTGIGIDISTEALEIADRNVRSFGYQDIVRLRQADFESLSDLAEELCQSLSDTGGGHGGFRLVLCNPPYASPRRVRRRVSAARATHEPSIALFGSEKMRRPASCASPSSSGDGGDNDGSSPSPADSNLWSECRAYEVLAKQFALALTRRRVHKLVGDGDISSPPPALFAEDAVISIEVGRGQLDRVRRIFERRTGPLLRYIGTQKDCTGSDRALVFRVVASV
jgi:HemK-like putative methylase